MLTGPKKKKGLSGSIVSLQINMTLSNIIIWVVCQLLKPKNGVSLIRLDTFNIPLYHPAKNQ